jgi:hypothetical protein
VLLSTVAVVALRDAPRTGSQRMTDCRASSGSKLQTQLVMNMDQQIAGAKGYCSVSSGFSVLLLVMCKRLFIPYPQQDSA